MIETTPAVGWYVFGIVPSDGIAAPGTSLVERGPLAAVTAEVSLAEFGEDVLPERLNDREWLEEKVRVHEAVLQSFVGVTPIVPLRFGAIYRDVDDVRRLLADRSERFEAVLERVSGRSELGVKAWFDPTHVTRPAAGSGREYLQRRRDELSSASDAAAAAAAAHARLATAADAAVLNRPQPRELSGRDEQMLLNGAYLVRDGDERFPAEVARLAAEHGERGITFELTGPWPPYNFAEDGA
jgi:Gas vesicle synthesis protein GvpL/GvpF